MKTGACACAPGWRGASCDDNADADAIEVHKAEGPFFSGKVLGLMASRAASPDYDFLVASSRQDVVFKVRGDGAVEARTVSAKELVNAGPLAQAGAAFFSSSVTVEATGAAFAVGADTAAPAFAVGCSKNGTVFVGRDGLAVAGSVDAFGDLAVGGSATVGGDLVALKGFEASSAVFDDLKTSALKVEAVDETALVVEAKGKGDLLQMNVAGKAVFEVNERGAVAVKAGGVRVEAGGLAVTGGGVDVSAGGLRVDGGIELRTGALRLGAGFSVSDGGFEAASSGAGTSPLSGIASSATFGGAVLRLEAPKAKVPVPFAPGALRAIEARIGGVDVFGVDGSGGVVAKGGLKTEGDVIAGGSAMIEGGLSVGRRTTKAGASVDVPSDATILEIAPDGATGSSNKIIVKTDRARASRQLVVVNKDNDAAFLGFHSIQPGHSALFFRDAAGGWDLVGTGSGGSVGSGGSTKGGSEMAGVTSFDARNDLDMGPHALRVGRLAARSGEASEKSVLYFGAKGFLESDPAVTVEISEETGEPRLKVQRLSVVKAVDGPLDLGGHAIRGARVEGGSAVGLKTLEAESIVMKAPPGTPTNPPPGFQRPALFGTGGKVEARPELYYKDETLHVPKLGSFSAAGPVDFGGQPLKNAKIQGGSVDGLDDLSLRSLRFVPLANDAKRPAMGTLAAFGFNGSLVPALDANDADAARRPSGSALLSWSWVCTGLQEDDASSPTPHESSFMEFVSQSLVSVRYR